MCEGSLCWHGEVGHETMRALPAVVPALVSVVYDSNDRTVTIPALTNKRDSQGAVREFISPLRARPGPTRGSVTPAPWTSTCSRYRSGSQRLLRATTLGIAGWRIRRRNWRPP